MDIFRINQSFEKHCCKSTQSFVQMRFRQLLQKIGMQSVLAAFLDTPSKAILLKTKKSSNAKALKDGDREDRIRTDDPLLPKQVLYQAELLPDIKYISNIKLTLFFFN